MIIRTWRIILAGSAISIAGCSTDLSVQKFDTASVTPVTGWTYSLPFVQYDLAITRTLTKCKADSFVLTPSAVAVQTYYVRDPEQTFTIDHTSLSSVMKTSSLKATWHGNQMLKTIGVEAQDHTGAVVVNTITGLAKIATTAAGFPPAAAATRDAERPPPAPLCDPKFENQIKRVETLKETLRKDTAALETATARHKALSESIALISRPDPALARRLVDSAGKLTDLQAKVAQDQAAVAKALEPLTDVKTIRWPTNGRDLSAEDKAPHLAAKWLRPGYQNDFTIRFQLVDDTGVGLRLPDGAKTIPDGAAAPTQTVLRYRSPVAGRVTADGCQAFNASGCTEDATMTKVAQSPVPQLGRLHLLPFHNGPFQDNILSAEFTEDGSLVSAGYSELASRAEAATDTIVKATAAAQAGISAARTARADSELAVLKAKTDLAEQKALYQKAVAALDPAPTPQAERQTALYNTDTDLKNAEIANIKATLALQTARASLSP